MSKIHVMSDNLANKIAAGEVVEKIASVVKELVENSIDAKSKSIIVKLIDSGTKSIEVIDDGIGMDREDAKLAFFRHATSKLLKEDDLFFINTLGFRGEALPSIASVSKVSLTTSMGMEGTHIEIEGGETKIVEASDARCGTSISVKDLFYNTPARLKYLKSDATELSNVTSFIERLSLTHPEISFSLFNNDRRIVYTSGSGELLKTIHELFGYDVSSNMIEIKASNDDVDIYGYICKPSVLKSNKNHMITIVNDRMVRNMDLNRAINEGYFNFKPDIKYPVCVIKIDTDPTLIDVNVHPTKQDIKISKINELVDLLTKTIDDSLKHTLLIQSGKVKEYDDDLDDDYEDNVIVNNYVHDQVIPYTESKEEDNSVQLALTDTFEEVKNKVVKEEDKTINKHEELRHLELYPQGIVFATYIIAQDEDAMYIIDQHAAHERINYERVLKILKDKEITTTTMLIPMTFEFSAADYIKLKNNLEILNDLGFVLEEFGINTYKVLEHPTWLKQGIEYDQTKEIMEMIIDGKFIFDRVKFNNHLAATMACKMSVKANEVITLELAQQILDDLVLCDNPYNCAHGRPTIVKYSKYELERMFKRVMN